MSPDAHATIDIGEIHPRHTLHPLGIYPGDPTSQWAADGFTKAVRTPDGHGTVHLRWPVGDASDRAGAGEQHTIVQAEAWGDGAAWLIDHVPDWLGVDDDLTGFDPSLHPKVHALWKRHRGVRMSHFGAIWQELVLVIIGQRVTSQEAVRSWAQLCRRWGHAAPGPHELLLPPEPEEMTRLHYTDLHTCGIERRRAEAILTAAKRANRLEEAAAMPASDAIQRLSALPQLGAWTATATVMVTHGDPDVLILGDYGMPTLVNYFFTGNAKRIPPDKGGDQVMLRHLEPWVGHRQRIMQLLMLGGVQAPRRAPRAFNPDIRRL